MGIFDLFFSSPFSKTYTELKNNDLVPQAMLLKGKKKRGYPSMGEGQRALEIKMLVVQKVNIIAAEMSRERFEEAQDICNQNGLEVGAKMFQDYIELYEHYIENYDKLGGPSSW